MKMDNYVCIVMNNILIICIIILFFTNLYFLNKLYKHKILYYIKNGSGGDIIYD